MAAHRFDRRMAHILPSESIQLHKNELLGKGGSSKVYKATYTNANGQEILVAAKKVPSQKIDDPEIKAMQRTKHKNVIKFYGLWKQNDEEIYIIMEHAPRGDLRNFLNECKQNNQRLAKPCIWKWIYEAACALQYFASLNLSHRDVKSLNFLIMEDYTLKLGDLGLARPLEKTQKTQGRGTCNWMAPEVTKDQKRSPKSDIHSFGIVVWEILTMGVPYADYKSNYHIMKAVCDGVRPVIPEDCTEVLRSLMTSCWDGDRNNRPDINDVCQSLLHYQSPSVSQFVEPDVGGTRTPDMGTSASAATSDVDMTSVGSSSGTNTLVAPELQEDNGHGQGQGIQGTSGTDMSTLQSTGSGHDIPMATGDLHQHVGELQVEITQDPGTSYRITQPVRSKEKLPVAARSLPSYHPQYYHMRNDPHGMCVIINNIDFSLARRVKHQDFTDREGSEVDADKLKQLFEGLHYQVEVYSNLELLQMYRILQVKQMADHSKYDCFVCCILTHGTNGKVNGCDGESIRILELTQLFSAHICPSLSGKPKLFIFESCQGNQIQSTSLEHDGPLTEKESIPNESDFILGYATVPGHVAYRHTTQGSWYIQTLVNTVSELCKKHDVQELLTMVNKNLSCKEDGAGNKQTASVFTTLRKKMFLCENPQASRLETV